MRPIEMRASARAGRLLIDILTAVLVLLAAWWLYPVAADVLEARVEARLEVLTGEPGTLLVIFQPADCHSYRYFISDWRHVIDEHEVRVLAVPLNVGSDHDALTLAHDLAVPYPIRPDLARESRSLLRRLRHRQTPVAVFLDPSGKPRLVLPANDTRDPHGKQAAITAYLENLK